MLPPISHLLLEPDVVPYFLWDLGLTVAQAHQLLATGDRTKNDEIILRILREANSRDVWLFLDWPAIEEAWPRIEHRLGRARPIWSMMLERYREHVRSRSAA